MSTPTMTTDVELAADHDAAANQPAKTLSICLINPRFEPSYWGFEFALPLYPGDKRSTMIPGSLSAVAGLCGDHQVYVLDENVEQIDWEFLQTFDIVGVTGMNVQKLRMRQILCRLLELDVFTVVGGPFVSVQEEFFEGLCDAVFVGEAETTWPKFLDDFARGKSTDKRYQQSAPTDMLQAPRPRFDLLKVDRYACGALQYSRGCPFQCEFCDIIIIYGRRPRVKDPDQLLAELDDMRRAGFHSAFIVDDNFIGNKKKAKALLEKLVPWMEQHKYPLRLTTEASIDLADDAELLELMYQANFRSVFIGIETPRMESLKETKKFQNTRGDSLGAKLSRIQNAGLDVNGGFIVGFDSDDKGIFDDQFQFIQENGITLAMVGMLQAIPKTPLYERLKRDGRLVEEDPSCNFVPQQMTREELRQGFWDLVKRLYSPEAYLDRYFKVYESPEYLQRRADICRRAGEGRRVPTLAYGLYMLWSLFWALAWDGSLFSIGRVYAKYFFTRNLRHRRDIIGFAQFMNRCVTHWHFYKFTREMTAGRLRAYNTI
ncbi:MAG TPA: B12-binding domain-containing radical SAM protein [Pirellulales bacterium]|nr:B12-binding domain-containing radical SAM protein [Pirellulales bacterium]